MRLKANLFAAVLLLLGLCALAQETDVDTKDEDDLENADVEAEIAEDEFDFDDSDDDLLFADAEDIEVEQSDASEYVASQQALQVSTSAYKIPLKFTGHLTSNFGYYGSENRQTSNEEFNNSAYFDLENYIYFLARVDKTLAVRGSVVVSFPPVSDVIELEELYLDYLLWDRIYITAGKKDTSWGYTRLFSGEDSYSLYTDKNYEKLSDEEKEEIRQTIEEQGYIYTDILSDSSNAVSAMMRIPFWTGTLTGIVLYDGSSDEPNFDEINLAGSLEVTLFHTTFNVFGRRDGKESDDEAFSVLLGAEAKRTVFDADVYAQGIGKLNDSHDDISKCIFTGGFYRIWNKHDPNFWINFEVQDSWNKELDKTSWRTYLEMGLRRLGKKHDWKIGLRWQHIIKSETDDDKSGIVKFGVEKSGLFPHAVWNNGVEVRYHQVDDAYENRIYKIRFGSYIKITMDY